MESKWPELTAVFRRLGKPMAGIDLSYIEAPMPGTVGAAAYKVRPEQELRKQAGEARDRRRAGCTMANTAPISR